MFLKDHISRLGDIGMALWIHRGIYVYHHLHLRHYNMKLFYLHPGYKLLWTRRGDVETWPKLC